MRKFFTFSAVLLLIAAGCASVPQRDYAVTVARFFIESASGQGGTATLPQSGVQISVSPKPVVTEFDIVNVEIAQVEMGKCLMFQLTPAAARDLYRLTASNQGRRLVLSLNDVAFGARQIERPFDEGTILIFAEMPEEELPALVKNLRGTAAELQRAARKS